MARQPHLQTRDGELHPIALLPGDPGRVDRIATACDESTTIARNREYKVVNAVYNGTPLTICSTGIGCPSAAIAIEELDAVGVETVIRVGTTGALQSHIDTGDLVIATGAAKDEGTTKRYEAATIPAVPSHAVLSTLIAVTDTQSDSYHVGAIVTDDAYYAETPEYVTQWEAAGLLAVEMEAAAIFALARRKHMEAGAICTVDGNLVAGEQKGITDGTELPASADETIDQMIGIGLDTAHRLAQE